MRAYSILLAGLALSTPALAQGITHETVAYHGDLLLNDWGLYRFLDRDGDGLSLSANELTDFAVDGAIQVTYVEDVKYRKEGLKEYVYIIAGGDLILRLEDLDGNGTCTDPGEITTWADTRASLGVLNTSPDRFDFDSITGTFYVTDDHWAAGSQPGAGIHAYTDLNADGDALDLGEFTQFVDALTPITVAGLTGPVTIDAGDFEGLMYDDTNGVVIGFSQQDVMLYAFQDLNGDGDAMDAGEAWNFCNLVGDVAGLELNADVQSGVLQNAGCPSTSGVGMYGSMEVLDFAAGAGPNGEDVFWIMSTTANASCPNTGGIVYRGIDLNGDLDLNDAGEVVLYGGGAAAPSAYPSAYGGAAHDGGFSMRAGSGDLVFFKDLNGDSNANGVGETTVTGMDPISHKVGELDAVPIGAFAHPSLSVNWQVFGTAGTNSLGLQPAIDHTGFPAIGTSFTVSGSNAIPNGSAVLAVGFSDLVWNRPPMIPLPFDLTGVGAPGNTLYVSVDYQFPAVADAAGNVSVLLNIPPHPGLVGQTLFFQWYCIDPLANAHGATTSNAASSVVE